MKIDVKPLDKQFGVYVDDELVGTTKLECDARYHGYRLGLAATNQPTVEYGPGLQGSLQNYPAVVN